MQISQSSITGSVTYNNIVTDKYHFYVKSDEAIIHRLYTEDFYSIKFDEESMLSFILNKMARGELSLDFLWLHDVCKIHCNPKNKMTMM